MTPRRAKMILSMIGFAALPGYRSRNQSFAHYVATGSPWEGPKVTRKEVAELLNMRLLDIIILITGRPEWVTNGVQPAEGSETAAAPSPSAPTAGRSRSGSTST
jgi:hypothetical protein